MMVAEGINIAASSGRDGIAVGHTGSALMSDAVLAGLDELAEAGGSGPAPNACCGANCPGAFGAAGWSSPYFNTIISSPRPAQGMRYVINTSAAPEHVGGNEKLASSATFKRAGGAGGFGTATRAIGDDARSEERRVGKESRYRWEGGTVAK